MGEEGGVASSSRGGEAKYQGCLMFLLHLCFILMRAEVRASHGQENREKHGDPKIAIWCISLHIKFHFGASVGQGPFLGGRMRGGRRWGCIILKRG